jgi:hypothetical protein
MGETVTVVVAEPPAATGLGTALLGEADNV